VVGGFIDACSEHGDGPLVTLLRDGLVECGGGGDVEQEGLLTDTTAPRTHLGEHSDWYIGTRQDTMSTLCSATPKEKTRQEATMLMEGVNLDPWESGETVRTPSTTKHITPRSGQKGAEESTSGEDE
jgi:hypothetical protein